MSRPKLAYFTLTSLAALALFAAPRAAEACGGTFCDATPFDPMPVDQRGEDILFAVDGGTVEVHVRIQYEGEAERFAWLLPIQAIPEISIGSDPLFASLLNTTVATWSRSKSYDCEEDDPSWNDTGDGDGDPGGTGDGDGDSGPNIVLQEVVGAFEIVVLQGGSAAEVINFLSDNNYEQDPDAEPILQEYLDEGFLFAAVKLTADAQTEDIHPLVFRFAGDEPCVPIRLTRIAAKDDMDIRAYFLGDSRWAPSNYAHVVLNPLAYDWSAPSPARYSEQLNAAVDEAGGRAFVTEYAGASNNINQSAIYRDFWDSSAFLELDPLGALIEMVNQGLSAHPLMSALLLEFIPPPPNVDPFDYWNNIDVYVDQINLDAWDAALFAAALDERIIEPGKNASELLDAWPTLTALHTTMSPGDMTEDPTFHAAPDLPAFGSLKVVTVEQVMCGAVDSIFHVKVEGEDQPVCVPGDTSYPQWDGEMPAALRIEQIPATGPAQVTTDNLALVTSMYDAQQADLTCSAVGGGGDTGTGDTSGSGGSGDTGGTGGTGGGLNGDSSACACSTPGEQAPIGAALGLLVLGLIVPRRRG